MAASMVSGWSAVTTAALTAPTGNCVYTPAQPKVPTARRRGPGRGRIGVPVFLLVDEPPFVWIWPRLPAATGASRPPRLPWINDPAWTTFASAWHVSANYMMVHEYYLDFSYVPVVHTSDLPPGLATMRHSTMSRSPRPRCSTRECCPNCHWRVGRPTEPGSTLPCRTNTARGPRSSRRQFIATSCSRGSTEPVDEGGARTVIDRLLYATGSERIRIRQDFCRP